MGNHNCCCRGAPKYIEGGGFQVKFFYFFNKK